jgi:hypothetical protein
LRILLPRTRILITAANAPPGVIRVAFARSVGAASVQISQQTHSAKGVNHIAGGSDHK